MTERINTLRKIDTVPSPDRFSNISEAYEYLDRLSKHLNTSINEILRYLNYTGLDSNDLDTDGTLTANSDTKLATQKATKTYADTKVAKSILTAALDLPYASGASAWTRLAKGAALSLLRMNSDATAIEWGGSGQIAFPAAVNASAGANVLDDYEEGQWTPTLGGTATYSTQGGSYIKFGRLVFVQARLVVTSIGTGSTTTIYGIPFEVSAHSTIGIHGLASSAVNVVYLTGQASAGSTAIVMVGMTGAAAAISTQAIFQNSTDVSLSGVYIVAA